MPKCNQEHKKHKNKAQTKFENENIPDSFQY